MLALVSAAQPEELTLLMEEVQQVRNKLDAIEGVALCSHQIRAGKQWELDGNRPLSFFFQRIEAKRRKHTLAGLLNDNGLLQATQAEMCRLIVAAFLRPFAPIGAS